LGNASSLGLGTVKDITEIFLDSGQGHFIPITGRDSFVEKIEASQLVNAVHMVGVVMGVKDAVDVGDPVPQALLAQVGGSVYQNLISLVFNHNGGTQTVVPGIVRLADGALATQCGNSCRGAGA